MLKGIMELRSRTTMNSLSSLHFPNSYITLYITNNVLGFCLGTRLSSQLPYFIYTVYTLKNAGFKYNPALGKIWTNPAIGLFLPSGWVTVQKVGLNI